MRRLTERRPQAASPTTPNKNRIGRRETHHQSTSIRRLQPSPLRNQHNPRTLRLLLPTATNSNHAFRNHDEHNPSGLSLRPINILLQTNNLLGCGASAPTHPILPQPHQVLHNNSLKRNNPPSTIVRFIIVNINATDHSNRPLQTTHYSFRRTTYPPDLGAAPKPLTSTYLVPPSPSKLPANVAISAETARLQTELLQLHLMHRDVEAVTRQWRGSAKEKLGGRFAALVETGEETGRLEAGAVERGNVQALAEWGGRGLEGRVQVLDEAVSGVWGLGEQGGRYAQLVRRFERWVGRVEEVGLLRAAGDLGKLVGEDGEVVMVGGMDGAWREECERIGRRLEEWNRQLKGLEGDVDGGSSLARILKGTRELVRDMLAELEVMRELEREVVAEEMRWVKAVSREMDDQTSSPQVKRAGAIWRAF
ncbi:hypothetical protein OQA88_282 [Cercophora sp. LCS_1]